MITMVTALTRRGSFCDQQKILCNCASFTTNSTITQNYSIQINLHNHSSHPQSTNSISIPASDLFDISDTNRQIYVSDKSLLCSMFPIIPPFSTVLRSSLDLSSSSRLHKF
ncbi:hypothetical protein EGW08_014805 [Elysia chlorotica]|uniref:Uncharacterized protein n=1 Tax=Elysia chlorotica TaxID=188477 RepID=A0A433T769_ELYCH|nr:hypothetical protein EGW08_014805 [Elysia chlorotica]